MSYILDLCDDLLSLLFPRLCHGCGKHLVKGEKLICTECIVQIPRTNYHNEVDNPVERLFWGRCSIEKATAFSFYHPEGRVKNLIHDLKYNGISDIGYELGKIFGNILAGSGFLKDTDIIIPVPLHPSKERKRGFNQSLVISRGIAEITGLPVDSTSLLRISGTATQTRKSRYERWLNVDGIFSVSDYSGIRGRHIVLVDDVITTGSTIESCANELLKAEGVKVSVVALAVTGV
jgi:ComF family protein